MLYGLINAAAYACLLPPWEGFDETYHYGYVQILSTQHAFPALDHAWLSREIWHALELTPVSHYLQPYTHAPLNFTDYFALPESERLHRRAALEALPREQQSESQLNKPNYEVNQAPLPYLILAPIESALAAWPITVRLLALRIAASFTAVLLLIHAATLLARRLDLRTPWLEAALFCALSSQMLYATICHVCNDWLAVPLFTYFVWAAIRTRQTGAPRDALLLGAIAAAALLTKAYFLAPLPMAFVAARRWKPIAWMTLSLTLLAGPWYIRNVLLYHNLSGTVQQSAGVSLRQTIAGAFRLPWLASIHYMALSSLWTGNNSFTTFSSATLYIVLLLLAAALILYARSARFYAPELLTISTVLVFCCALAGISVTFFLATKGGAIAAVPWYMQLLLAPVLLLAFLGLQRTHGTGHWLAIALAAIWGYILIATYWIKLIPLYAGYPPGRARLSDLWAWYLHAAPARTSILATLCLTRPAILYALAASASLLCLALLGIHFRHAQTRRSHPA